MTVTAVGRMTKFTLTFYDALPSPTATALRRGGGGDGLSLATALYMYQNGTVYNTGETV